MGTVRADRERQVSATSRLAVMVPPRAAERLRQLAIRHQMPTRAALLRSAIEAYAHASHTERTRARLPPAGPPPPPEPATVNLSIAVTVDTARAVERLAVTTAQTKTAIIRTALDVLAAESGQPPVFAAEAHQQKWPTADILRRPRGPAAKVPGIARRCPVGLRSPSWFARKFRRD